MFISKRILLGLLVFLILSGYVLPISAKTEKAIISDLDWNPSGTQIAIGISALGTQGACVLYPDIHLLNYPSQKMMTISKSDSECSATNVDFNVDGSQLLTTSDAMIEIWNMAMSQRVHGFIMETRFQHAFWHPTNSTFLDVDASGVDIRNADDLLVNTYGLISPGRLEGEKFTFSAWSPDGKTIASSMTDGKIYIWNTDDQQIVRTFTAHTAPVQRLVWNSALDLIASGDDSGKILVWNPTTGGIVAELSGHTGAIRDLDWRTDEKQLASAGADNTVRIWAWPSGDMQLVEADQSIWSVAYSPDGSVLAYGGELTDPQDIASHIFITPTTPSPTLLPSTVTPTD